jgi:anthranilate synthase component 1
MPQTLIPHLRTLPTDTITPVSAFLRLRAHFPGPAYLLENSTPGQRGYSLLGVEPFATARIQGGVLRWQEGDQEQIIPGEPLTELGRLLQQYQSIPLPDMPPFLGGAVGFLGFDCIQYLEPIVLPPGGERDEACLMFFKAGVIFDHARHRLILFANVDSASGLPGEAQAQATLERLEAALEEPVTTERSSRLPNQSPESPELEGLMGEEAYCQAVRKIKAHIRQGDIFQCVLADRFTQPLRTEPFNIYRVLRSLNPSPYLFFLDTGREILLGASPEMLVQCENGTISTCPIAGTRPRGQTPAEDLKMEKQMLSSVKERAEHLMLVDLGRNDIGRSARPGTVKVPEFMQVHRFSHVMHLVSLVQGELAAGKTAWDALLACFPAGTLSGAPKVRALQILSELEPARRGPYGGAILYASFSGALDSCITIRSLHIYDGHIHVQAGAGIVADSRPAAEYQEVRAKSRAILRAVQLAHLQQEAIHAAAH